MVMKKKKSRFLALLVMIFAVPMFGADGSKPRPRNVKISPYTVVTSDTLAEQYIVDPFATLGIALAQPVRLLGAEVPSLDRVGSEFALAGESYGKSALVGPQEPKTEEEKLARRVAQALPVWSKHPLEVRPDLEKKALSYQAELQKHQQEKYKFASNIAQDLAAETTDVDASEKIPVPQKSWFPWSKPSTLLLNRGDPAPTSGDKYVRREERLGREVVNQTLGDNAVRENYPSGFSVDTQFEPNYPGSISVYPADKESGQPLRRVLILGKGDTDTVSEAKQLGIPVNIPLPSETAPRTLEELEKYPIEREEHLTQLREAVEKKKNEVAAKNRAAFKAANKAAETQNIAAAEAAKIAKIEAERVAAEAAKAAEEAKKKIAAYYDKGMKKMEAAGQAKRAAAQGGFFYGIRSRAGNLWNSAATGVGKAWDAAATRAGNFSTGLHGRLPQRLRDLLTPKQAGTAAAVLGAAGVLGAGLYVKDYFDRKKAAEEKRRIEEEEKDSVFFDV